MIIKKDDYKRTYTKTISNSLKHLFVENPNFEFKLEITVYFAFETNYGLQRMSKHSKVMSLVVKDLGSRVFTLNLDNFDNVTIEETLRKYYINRIKLHGHLFHDGTFNFKAKSIRRFINPKYLTLWELEE